MFELNDNIKIEEEIVDNSVIYTIENFYKNPDEILNHFLLNEASLHKGTQKPSYNGIHFEDRRHFFYSDEMINVYNFLEKLCGHIAVNQKNIVESNCARFIDFDFNSYKDNYWWPHYDPGYTGIIYFNRDDFKSGTNLYKPLDNLNYLNTYSEHSHPWRSKKYFKVIKLLEPNFNKLVLFDGKKFLHGMHICDDRYFGNEFRINQPLFFHKI